MKPNNILGLLVSHSKPYLTSIYTALNPIAVHKPLCPNTSKKLEDKENVKIQWTILHSTKNDVPLRSENCSICNLERLAIAEAERNKTLNTRNVLAIICPHHKLSYF